MRRNQTETTVACFQLAIGDICGDPTGLRVRAQDVDTYDYVHFSVIEGGERERLKRNRAKCPMWHSSIASRSWATRLLREMLFSQEALANHGRAGAIVQKIGLSNGG
jgi:hypothetical protein